MEYFLTRFKSLITLGNSTLIVSYSQDYLTNNLKYLEEISKDDNLRSILTDIKIIIYRHNVATSLKWLKYFPNVIELDCDFNNLDSSSLESLKYISKLEKLTISNNDIDDLSNLKFAPNLCNLYCYSNKITTFLNISTNFPKLQSIICTQNKLKSINISNCLSLMRLNCSHNDMTELILHNATNLRFIYCKDNQLTSLNVADCKLLQTLNCMHNQIIELNLQGLVNLNDVYCSFNNICSLNIKECKALKLLNCEQNQLTKLDLSDCLHLKTLICSHNNISNVLETCKHLELDFLDYDRILTFISYQGLEKCYICIDTSGIKEENSKILTNCRHVFHKKCLTIWLNISTKCPYCNQLI